VTMVKNKKNKKGKAKVANTNKTTNQKENLDELKWLRECDLRRDSQGESYLQLEYQDDDEIIKTLRDFLADSAATKEIVLDVYQIWQQTVLSTLLASSALWQKDTVSGQDQRLMKEHLKLSRYKINFIMHHVVGSMMTSTDVKWMTRKADLLAFCHNTLMFLPRLAESCPHHRSDVRQAMIHFEGKDFLAATACETWDTLYDFSIPIDPDVFVPVLRRCAMLDILDKDWNMLGGWEDILRGLEAKCFPTKPIQRLPADRALHEQTTILRNARNSMQCKFFSVRFMKYTEDQAPQRWRYFPKCSAPACSHIESPSRPHKYRCKSCWYFHYCSASCQEYCDNIMGLHKKFCKDTPKDKALQCQKDTQKYLGWITPDECEQLVCNACGSTEDVDESKNNNTINNNGGLKQKMKRCQQCRSVFYCGRQCQEWDWRVGGHREACKAAGGIQPTGNMSALN